MQKLQLDSNIWILRNLLEFYISYPEVDIKDNKYCLYFLANHNVPKEDVTEYLVRRISKFIMLIRVSVLEEKNIYDSIISQY